MEASKLLEPELQDPFEREVEAALPEGEDRASAMLRADYLLQRIREEEARAEELAQFTARRINMVQEHGTGELLKIRKRVQWLESRLRMHVPPTGDGMEREFSRRSLSLPHGTVGYRRTPESVEILDQAKALQWAKDNGLQVAVKETVHKAPIIEYIRSTGAMPDTDAIEYRGPSESFYVKPKGEE